MTRKEALDIAHDVLSTVTDNSQELDDGELRTRYGHDRQELEDAKEKVWAMYQAED